MTYLADTNPDLALGPLAEESRIPGRGLACLTTQWFITTLLRDKKGR